MAEPGQSLRPATPEELRAIRFELELSQTDLLITLGCSPASLSYWENGHRSPLYRSFVAWAAELGHEVLLRRREVPDG